MLTFWDVFSRVFLQLFEFFSGCSFNFLFFSRDGFSTFRFFLGRALVILFFAWAHWARASHAYGTHRARIGTMTPHVSAYVPHNARLRAACHYWTLVLQTRSLRGSYVDPAWFVRGPMWFVRGPTWWVTLLFCIAPCFICVFFCFVLEVQFRFDVFC